MKLILAAILAGSFLVSLPVRADDEKAPSGDSAKSKSKSKSKKADKGDKKSDDSASKPSGGGW